MRSAVEEVIVDGSCYLLVVDVHSTQFLKCWLTVEELSLAWTALFMQHDPQNLGPSPFLACARILSATWVIACSGSSDSLIISLIHPTGAIPSKDQCSYT